MAIAILNCSLPLLACAAHPFHTSLTEMDWNPQTRSWEVGLRVDANDLESAIRQHRGNQFSQFSLDNESSTNQIRVYIADRFHLLPNSRAMASASEASGSTPLISELASSPTGHGDLHRGRGGLQPSTTIDAASPAGVAEAAEVAEVAASVELHWLGHEMEGSWVWLYFELIGPKLDQLTVVKNSVLGEINEDQLNILAVRQGKLRYSLQTSARRWWAELMPASPDSTPVLDKKNLSR